MPCPIFAATNGFRPALDPAVSGVSALEPCRRHGGWTCSMSLDSLTQLMSMALAAAKSDTNFWSGVPECSAHWRMMTTAASSAYCQY